MRARADYLGEAGHKEIAVLKEQLARQQHLYWLRKRACLDLIEVFSELYKTEAEQFKQQMGLDEDDFHDKDI